MEAHNDDEDGDEDDKGNNALCKIVQASMRELEAFQFPTSSLLFGLVEGA